LNKIFLAKERIRLGLKAKDVAEYAGIAIPTQSNYEQGKRNPDTDYLLKIAELGFDLNFVLTGRRNNNNLSTQEKMLLELFRNAPESVQRYILAGLITGEITENTEGPESSSGNTVRVGDSNHGDVAGRDIRKF